MEIYFFSPKEGGFYSSKVSPEIPSDAVEITEVQHAQFAGVLWPEGKQLGADSEGYPCWVDSPPPSKDELIAAAEVKKSQLRSAADAEIVWRQDAVDAGIATAEETAALNEWKKYRVLLMRVDATAPVWPTVPMEQTR